MPLQVREDAAVKAALDAFGGGEGGKEGGEFEDFEVGRAGGPVVAPADDDVAAGGGMAVVAEIAALKFKFEADALPAVGADLALGFAVGKAGLHGLDDVAEFLGDHAEEQDDALFVDGFVAEAAEVEGGAIDWAILQGRVVDFGGRARGSRLAVGRGVFAGWQEPQRRGRRCCGGVRRGAWDGLRDGTRAGDREKGEDVGPGAGPSGMAASKIAKNLRESGPGAEAALGGAGVILSAKAVEATRRDGAVGADEGGPIFEEGAILEAEIQGVRGESGGAKGVVPGGEKARDLMFGNAGEGMKFGTGGRATGAAGEGAQVVKNTVLIGLEMHRTFCAG